MQSAPRSQSSWRKAHLWLMLQALGFEVGSEAASLGRTLTHIPFGVNMFDKPNKDAFYVVFHFLFSKLNGVQCKEVFRYCWPPLDKKKDAEFRKVSCEWLKKISEDAGNGFPQVVASIFLSPGGPKFLQLVYHFARYVMLQHVKRDVDGTNSFVSSSLQCRVQDPQKALARNTMAQRGYLRTLQRENFVVKEYHKKAQLLVKQIRDLRSECVTLQNQYRETNVKKDDENEVGIEENRNLWANIMHKLKAIEKEVEVVDSVVSGDVDQCVLDGSKVSLNMPNVLVTRIESEMHRLQMENVYEAGKVNLITIIQLLNEALKIIHSERNSTGEHFQVDVQYLAAKVKFETEVFTRLKHTRHKIKREDLVSINKSIVDKEHDWEKKWKRILGKSPFSLFRGLNPVLELQPPLAPFSFDPAAEEALKSSVFSEYPASLPDISSKDSSVSEKEESFTNFMDATLFTPRGRQSLPFHNRLTQRRMSLNEKDFRTPTSAIKDRFLPRTPVSLQKKRIDVTQQSSPNSVLPHTPTSGKPNARSVARLHLAQQVADYIVNDVPRSQSGRGMELDDLIGMLSSDPFLSRKEIPRTPENLITDIRTSWRKAIQNEEFTNLSSPAEDPCVESPIEQEPAQCSQVDLSMACFLSASHLSEHNESPDSRGPIITLESSPHEQSVLSPSVITSLTGAQKTFEQDRFTPLKKCEKAKTLGSSLEERNHTFVSSHPSISRLMDSTMLLPSPGLENGCAHYTLSWNSSKANTSGSDNLDVIQFGILHETMPDTAANLSLNSTASAESPDVNRYDSKVENNDLHLESSMCGLNATEHKTDLNSLRNRYEALKRTFITSLTEDNNVDYSTLSQVSMQKSESGFPVEGGSVLSPSEKGLTLDLEYLTTPSPRDRKLSLPQLISFSPCEDNVCLRAKVDLSDVLESQGAGNINETFDYTHSTSALQKSTDEGAGQLIML